MSYITDVIICFSAQGPGNKSKKQKIKQINDMIKEYHGPFVEVSDYAGGSKVFCHSLLIGAFNYFYHPEDFAEKMKNLGWDDCYFCWVMLRFEQHPWGDRVWIKEDHTWD